jgi:hypothetical protein
MPDRRTLAELVALYSLEPRVRDVVVEGAKDATVVRLFARERGLANVTVRDVSSIEVPGELCIDAGLPDSNRGRVLAVARRVEDMCGVSSSQLTCIVDADFDHVVVGGTAHGAAVIATDGTCMEMQLVSEPSVQRVLDALGVAMVAGEVLDLVAPVVHRLFCLRLANHVLGLELTWVTAERCCDLSSDGRTIILDESQLVSRYLNTKGRLGERAKLLELANRVETPPAEQFQTTSNGHDFLRMVGWLIRKRTGRRISEETLFSLLVASASVERLAASNLFRTLEERIKR